MTDSIKDQDHLEMMIYSKPSIPDRTEFILGRSEESPVESMIEIGNALFSMGADFIAIPCITAHYFHEILEEKLAIPIIHLVKETVEYLSLRGVSRVGIMATDGTICSALFQEELHKQGMVAIIPSKDGQSYVNDLIYKDIKAGKRPQMDKFHMVSKELKDMGAESIVLGCTELSLIKRDYPIGAGFIDAMEVLAMCAIRISGAKLKEDYYSLITS